MTEPGVLVVEDGAQDLDSEDEAEQREDGDHLKEEEDARDEREGVARREVVEQVLSADTQMQTTCTIFQ